MLMTLLCLLLSTRAQGKPPCQEPPQLAPVSVVDADQSRENQVVLLTPESYANLYAFYLQCLVARSGTRDDWQRFVKRSDQATEIALGAQADAPFLKYLVDIETSQDRLTNLDAQLAELNALLANMQAALDSDQKVAAKAAD